MHRNRFTYESYARRSNVCTVAHKVLINKKNTLYKSIEILKKGMVALIFFIPVFSTCQESFSNNYSS